MWCVCVDSIGCAGLSSVGDDDSSLSCVHFSWSHSNSVVAVKINCLSTEFAAKKHGEGAADGTGVSRGLGSLRVAGGKGWMERMLRGLA